MLRATQPTLLGRRWGMILAAAMIGLIGCTRDGYDASIHYPVRTDWLVNVGTFEVQPSRFTLPGILPLDRLRDTLKLLPLDMPADQVRARADELIRKHETTPDLVALRSYVGVGKMIRDPQTLPADVRAAYAQHLEAMFGTPAQPKVSGLNADALKALDESLTPDAVIATLGLQPDKLAHGSRVYRDQCLHCHGMDGNGRGPTGYWVNPPPRDYRQGIFKFTSSSQDEKVRKPRREDIMHVITTGIEGSSMPSFGLLPLADREALVSYVIHLSLRGEAEYRTMLDQLSDDSHKIVMTVREDGVQNPTVKDALEDNLALAASRWFAAQQPGAAIQPSEYPYPFDEAAFLQSAARGAKVFLGAGGCIACHQNYGRESNLTYDAWATIVRGRNLYDGVYRGGRRPIDLFYRIHSGINGAGMTAYKDIKSQIKPDDIGVTPEQFEKIDPLWDLVNFLRALGYVDLRARLRDEFQIKLPE